MDEINLWSKYV